MPSERTAALYIRVSTDDQLDYSPDAQKRALLAYAEKNQYLVSPDHIYIEEGKSGRFAEKRPAFMRMISAAKAKPRPFAVILVHKFDRFARNRQDSIVYKAMLKKENGIRVISITEAISEGDTLSVLIEAMLEAMAEYYSINLAEEVTKGMTEKARQGGFQTSPPLGYCAQNGVLSVLPDEADIVRDIYRRFVEYGDTPFAIAQALRAAGIRTKRGHCMDARGVVYILQNPVYIGMLRWTPGGKLGYAPVRPDTIVAKGAHEAIIPPQWFQTAAQKLALMKKRHQKRSRPLSAYVHWLSGLVKCSACGSVLVAANTLQYPSFRCSGYARAQCDCPHGITIARLEQAVLAGLDAALGGTDSGVMYTLPEETAKASAAWESCQIKLAKLNEKCRRAAAAYYAGVDSLEDYARCKLRLSKEQAELSAALSLLAGPSAQPDKPPSCFHSLSELLLSGCDMRVKQLAIRSIVHEIVYMKPERQVVLILYDPVA